MALTARNDAELRGVADAGANFTGQDGADQFVAARLMQDEGCAGNEIVRILEAR